MWSAMTELQQETGKSLWAQNSKFQFQSSIPALWFDCGVRLGDAKRQDVIFIYLDFDSTHGAFAASHAPHANRINGTSLRNICRPTRNVH
jgi:hypothetical protein